MVHGIAVRVAHVDGCTLVAEEVRSGDKKVPDMSRALNKPTPTPSLKGRENGAIAKGAYLTIRNAWPFWITIPR